MLKMDVFSISKMEKHSGLFLILSYWQKANYILSCCSINAKLVFSSRMEFFRLLLISNRITKWILKIIINRILKIINNKIFKTIFNQIYKTIGKI